VCSSDLWLVALPGCPRSVHVDLPVDFYTTKLPNDVRARFGAEGGFHWAVDDARRIYAGPVFAVTGAGLALSGTEHRLDNWRLAPQLNLRGFADWWLAFEGSLGPVLDLSLTPDRRWQPRPAAQAMFGPRLFGVLQLRAGYELVAAAGSLPPEGRYILGASVTFGGALIAGGLAGLTYLCERAF